MSLWWVYATSKGECNIVFSAKLQSITCSKVALKHCMAVILHRSFMTLSLFVLQP